MSKINKFGVFLLSVLFIVSCDGGSGSDSNTSGDTSSTSVEVIDEYDDWLNTWSESDHLYIHYRLFLWRHAYNL